MRTRLDGTRNLPMEIFANFRSCQRPNVYVRVHRIADIEAFHALDKQPLEVVVDAFRYYESLGGNTRLSIVDDPGIYRVCYGIGQVHAGHYDEGIAAT